MEQNNSKQKNQSEIELNFIEILRILLNSKRLIILATIAFGAIGWIYSIYFNPVLPPNYESSSVIEIGSYPASDENLSDSRDGRILIASMDASVARLNSLFAIQASKGSDLISDKPIPLDQIIKRVSIREIDSQFLKIEVVAATIDIVKNKNNEIIEYLGVSHKRLLDKVISKKKREIKNIGEKLLTIDKFINTITKDNNIYISDVAELKLKEIEYKYELNELSMHLSNMQSFRNTDLVGEIQVKINHSKPFKLKMIIASFIIGFSLSLIIVLMRHALVIANNKE